MRTWLGGGLTIVGAAAFVGVGCFLGGCFSNNDDSESDQNEVNENQNKALSAVIAIENGCSATKVGPKQILLAARCVANKPAFAIGKTFRFSQALPTTTGRAATSDASADGDALVVADAGAAADASSSADASPSSDASASAADAGDGGGVVVAASDAGPAGDAGGGAVAVGDAAAPPNANLKEATIAQVQIHPSFLAQCGTGACAPGLAGGADVADVAVIILTAELTEIPTAPIDLDPIKVGEKVLALGYGCGEVSRALPPMRAQEMTIASPMTVGHEGSPYKSNPDLIQSLALSYVVTRGPALREGAEPEASLLGLCTDRDYGAPLVRANGSAVVGVGSNFTASGPAQRSVTSTNAYARVSTASRHQIGKWLGDLGVKTTSSCAGTDAGCPDAGPELEPADASAGSNPEAGSTDPGTVDNTENPPLPSTEDDESDPTKQNPAPKKPKKDVGSSGCSASPSNDASSGFGAVLLAVGALALTRRRRRRTQ